MKFLDVCAYILIIIGSIVIGMYIREEDIEKCINKYKIRR
jgi:hypothetical protein